MEKKGIIFDWDGVLYPSTEQSMKKLINNATLALGEEKTPQLKLVKKLWGQSIYHMTKSFSIYLRWNSLDEERFLNLHLKDTTPLKIESEKMKKIIKMLHNFKEAGKDLHILSNRKRDSIAITAKDIGIDLKIFKTITGSNTLKKKNGSYNYICKPNPLILSPILFKNDNKGSANLKDFIFIGDSIDYDFILATQTNLDFVGIISLLHSEKAWKKVFKENKLPEKRFLVNNVLDLPLIIK